MSRFDDAEKAYLAALAARPGWIEPEYNLCVLHQQFTQKYAEAKPRCVAYLAKIDKTHPKFAEVTKRIKSIDVYLQRMKPTTP